jgi:hypothetical protein
MGVVTEIPTNWENYYCSDAADWGDLSKDNNTGGDNNCNELVDDCQFKDKISGLVWSELFELASPATWTWSEAIAKCGVTMNTVGGNGGGPFAGQTDWRLPTQKELMTAYIHGIKVIEGPNFIDDVDTYYWSSTATAADPGVGHILNLGSALASHLSKSIMGSKRRVLCVR